MARPQWEWVALRFENGDLHRDGPSDARRSDRWFYQAIGTSPAMFRRGRGPGSLYWLGTRDGRAPTSTADELPPHGPAPVPAGLFWSVTVYDAVTRTRSSANQGKAALRSLFELKPRETGRRLTCTSA